MHRKPNQDHDQFAIRLSFLTVECDSLAAELAADRIIAFAERLKAVSHTYVREVEGSNEEPG